jgi:hypothetical protein
MCQNFIPYYPRIPDLISCSTSRECRSEKLPEIVSASQFRPYVEPTCIPFHLVKIQKVNSAMSDLAQNVTVASSNSEIPQNGTIVIVDEANSKSKGAVYIILIIWASFGMFGAVCWGVWAWSRGQSSAFAKYEMQPVADSDENEESLLE